MRQVCFHRRPIFTTFKRNRWPRGQTRFGVFHHKIQEGGWGAPLTSTLCTSLHRTLPPSPRPSKGAAQHNHWPGAFGDWGLGRAGLPGPAFRLVTSWNARSAAAVARGAGAGPPPRPGSECAATPLPCGLVRWGLHPFSENACRRSELPLTIKIKGKLIGGSF